MCTWYSRQDSLENSGVKTKDVDMPNGEVPGGILGRLGGTLGWTTGSMWFEVGSLLGS